MSRAGDFYSSFVTLAKIALPLLALALLSTLFLLARQDSDGTDIPYSDVELQDIVEGQRIAQPDFQSVLSDGSEINMVAESARPDILKPSVFHATEIVGEIVAPDGEVIAWQSAEGVFDSSENTLALQGGLRIRHSSGFELTAPGADADLEGRRAVTTGASLITGPDLWLKADKAEGTQSPEVVVFTGNVKLIYTPSN